MTYYKDEALHNEVLEIVREMPGVAAHEVVQLMPHRKTATVHSVIYQLKNKGVISENGKKPMTTKKGVTRPVATFVFNNVPVPPAKTRVPKMKVPTNVGYEARIQELIAKINELEAWKMDALDRYPDLAVPPLMLRARKLVADEVRAGGDNLLAQQIIGGLKDNTLMVRVALKALEENA